MTKQDGLLGTAMVSKKRRGLFNLKRKGMASLLKRGEGTDLKCPPDG